MDIKKKNDLIFYLKNTPAPFTSFLITKKGLLILLILLFVSQFDIVKMFVFLLIYFFVYNKFLSLNLVEMKERSIIEKIKQKIYERKWGKGKYDEFKKSFICR